MAGKKNDFGITSLILGIFSIIFSWSVVLSIPAGIIGIVFSVKQKKIYENGVSTAGFVTSIVGLGISFLVLLFFLFIFIPMGMYMR